MTPKTIPTQAPQPPAWVDRDEATLWAWQSDLAWRCEAAKRGKDPVWRKILRRQAESRLK